MPGTYKLITLVGTSPDSFADAAATALREANRTVRGITWFEVDELRGRVGNGRVEEYQVTLRAGFHVEGPTSARRPAKRPAKRRSAKRRR